MCTGFSGVKPSFACLWFLWKGSQVISHWLKLYVNMTKRYGWVQRARFGVDSTCYNFSIQQCTDRNIRLQLRMSLVLCMFWFMTHCYSCIALISIIVVDMSWLKYSHILQIIIPNLMYGLEIDRKMCCPARSFYRPQAVYSLDNDTFVTPSTQGRVLLPCPPIKSTRVSHAFGDGQSEEGTSEGDLTAHQSDAFRDNFQSLHNKPSLIVKIIINKTWRQHQVSVLKKMHPKVYNKLLHHAGANTDKPLLLQPQTTCCLSTHWAPREQS